MMQKMLWISTPFLIYYFNYLTFYRPPLVEFFFFFWLRFQFSVSCWKLFIIIISKIQNLLAVFIKFIYRVQPLENDKESALVRVPKCFMQNYLSIRMIKSSLEYLEPIRFFFFFFEVLTNAVTGSWDRLVGRLLYFCPDDPVGSGGKKWMAIYHLRKEISTSCGRTTKNPTSRWGTGQAVAEGRGDDEPRSGVRGLEKWRTSPNAAPTPLVSLSTLHPSLGLRCLLYRKGWCVHFRKTSLSQEQLWLHEVTEWH